MKLSIITPTRNRLAYLKQNIASVRASVCHPLPLEIEHIILDCGSDDGTAEWLQTSEAEGLHVILKDGPIPPGRARDIAIRESSGDFIMPLDDDDLVLQRAAFHFVEALSSGSHQQWAVADFLKIDSEGRYLPGEDYYAWQFDSPDEMLQSIFSGTHYIQGNVCFRRDLYTAVGGYSQMETAEDLELYSRFVLQAGTPRCIGAVSHLHRIHESNVSRDIDKNQYNRDMAEIYEANRSSLEARGISLTPIP